jgi:MYXO-CTERM domain-containing protein
MSSVASGATFVAVPAHAGDVVTDTGPALGANASVGAAPLHYEQHEGLFPDGIQTGFLGPAIAKVNVGIKIDPVINGGPLYAVDMPRGALVQASWSNDKRIVLKPLSGLQTDGQVSVRHTLTPSIDFDFGFVKFSFDATKLLNFIPGASFAFDSRATQMFSPWAFTAVDTKLTAPDLDNAQLFSLGMDQLPDFVANSIKGSFGVRATTEPTFSYRTTKITFVGASGQITDATGELTVPAVDGDAMEVMTTVEGVMAVSGSIQIQPFVRIQQIGSLPAIPIDLGIDVFQKDYDVPGQTVAFQTVMVHIPMPNVHVPTGTVQLGSGGGQVTIENSGEKEATMTFQSSSPQLAVTSEQVRIPAKSKYDLQVRVSGDVNGVTGEIKVLSNDADSPEQIINVGADGNGGAASDPSASKDPVSGQSDSGCGCKAAGSPATPSWAGAGILALGAAVMARRRRRRL